MSPKGSDGDDSCLHGIAFAELVSFMEDMKSDGLTVEKRIHTTRLKNRLLSALPDLRAHSQGRDTLLIRILDQPSDGL